NNLPEAFFSVDIVNNKMLQVSPAHLTVFGYPPEEFFKNPRLWYDIINPEDKQIIDSGYPTLAAGKILQHQFRIVNPSGEVHWIEARISPNLDVNGKLVRIDGIASNITERKNNELKLKESEEKYRTLFENMLDGYYKSTPEGKFVEVNPALVKMFGYDNKEELLAIDIKTNLYFDTLDREYAQSEAIKKGITRFRLRKKDGSEIWVEDQSRNMMDKNGNVLFYEGLLRDVTERQRSEEKIELLSRAIEQSPVSVMIADSLGKIIYINPKFTELTGYSFKEAVGNNPKILKSNFHNLEFYEDMWSTILSGKNWTGELLNKKKEGELYWEKAIISPSITDGKITHFIALKEDITEKKKIIEELIDAKEKAEEASRLKSNFLANMSHELRNPMVGILGYAEIMEQEFSDPQQLEIASIIKQSGNRLMETLNSILDLSRIEANKHDINITPVNLIELINESVTLYKPLANRKGLFLNFKSLVNSIYINSDKDILTKVFSNLINNAIKYTQTGDITIKVSINANLNNNVIIDIVDTGIGILEEFHQVIFEPFRQVSEGLSRKFEGNGLGLSITKKFVELLGGSISLKSKPGKGSTFSVLFPLIIPEGNNKTAPDKLPVVIESELGLISSIVLLVEDDPVNASVICAYLKDYVSVEHFSDGNQAVEQCKTKLYDAVLMDIGLRGINGNEALKLIRCINEHYSGVPVIAITAYAMKGDKEKFLSLGFTHYLSKPFQRSELLSLLSAIFQGSYSNE
ncbi:MAG TPA: PAS domain S-box protein, partial [Ignavibacteriaceae bacterium]